MANRILAEAWPVGYFLGEEMYARGWTDEDVADRMGSIDAKDHAINTLTVMAIRQNALINGEECEVGLATSAKLRKAFGVSPDFFLNLERLYRLAVNK